MKKWFLALTAQAVVLCMLLSSAFAQSYADHALTQSRADGSCKVLEGEMEMIVLSVSTDGAAWDDAGQSALQAEVERAVQLLEEKAAGYGVTLDVQPLYHQTSTQSPADVDTRWVNKTIKKVPTMKGWSSKGWKNIPLLLCFYEEGRAYTQTRYGSEVEYVVLFRGDPAGTIQHEMLHLFGAEDYYIHSDVKSTALTHYPNSIMLNASEDSVVDGLTAYLVGWAGEPDDTARAFLDATQHLTLDDLNEALGEEMTTGEGFFELEDGVYYGQMQDGCLHGEGCMRWNDGSVYYGEWKWNVRHGNGTYVWADGTTYSGSYVEGERTGKGSLHWPNGDMYTGDFVAGKRTGEGVFRWADGSMYTGDFVDDNFHGTGTYLWPSGDSYTGEYQNDMKHGRGTFAWANGTTYVGEFVNDAKHGQGTITYSDGTVQSGTWENDEFVR